MRASIYISRKVLNYHDIVDWAKASGFTSMMPVDNLHVTVVYCKHKINWSIVDRDQDETVLIPGDDDRGVHEFNGGACVLEIKSDDLLQRNEELRKQGIHSSFPDYRAHITITYKKPRGLKVTNIEPYSGPIILGPEIIEEASNGWTETYEEIPLTGPDINHIYDVFCSLGGESPKEKFLNRAKNWTFYGDDTGFVAFREQPQGTRKLIGWAGDTRGIVLGMQQLEREGVPTWGLVSKKLAMACGAFGFTAVENQTKYFISNEAYRNEN